MSLGGTSVEVKWDEYNHESPHTENKIAQELEASDLMFVIPVLERRS